MLLRSGGLPGNFSLMSMFGGDQSPSDSASPSPSRRVAVSWWILGLAVGISAVAVAVLVTVKVIYPKDSPYGGVSSSTTSSTARGTVTYEVSGPSNFQFIVSYNDSMGSRQQPFVSLPWTHTVVIGDLSPVISVQQIGFGDVTGIVIVIKRGDQVIARCADTTSCHA